MVFGRRRRSEKSEDDHAVHEMLDPLHHRASMNDGDRLVLNPSQVLDNIAHAMERLDLDIDTPVSIEEDVASTDELWALVSQMCMGSMLVAHVLNTAATIMTARYPADLVTAPFPPHYDLRKITPIQVDDRVHDIAKTLFNQRMTGAKEVADSDIDQYFAPLTPDDQLRILMALFYMYGNKIGALKYTTGIP